MAPTNYDSLGDRTQKAYDRAESTGNFEDYFKKGLNLPLWKIKEGVHTFDVVPYSVGLNHPDVVKGEIKEGDPDFILDLFVHNHIGPNQNTYVCPNKTYLKPCPICEHIKELRKEDGNEAVIDEIRAKRRNVFNVVVYDSDEEEKKGVQVLEIAHFNMQQKLAPLTKNPRVGGVVIYAHPKTGKSISFKREGSGFENTKYIGHQFLDRVVETGKRDVKGQPVTEEYEISSKILAAAYQLDDLIVILSYEELSKIYYGGGKKVEEVVDACPVDEQLPSGRRRRGTYQPETSTSNPCPAGFKFGEDWDSAEQCQTCETVKLNSCAEEWDRLDALKKTEAAKPVQTLLRRRRA